MRTGQPAPDQGILTLLKKLFVHHGHMVTDGAQLEGKSGSVYEIPILAESETGAVVVGAHEGPGALSERDVESFRHTVSDVAADRGVLVHLGPATPAALDAAGGLVLWDRAELGRLVGDACLAEALGETAAALTFETPRREERLAPEQVSDLLPVAFATDMQPGRPAQPPERLEPDRRDETRDEPFTLPEIAASVSSMFEAPLDVAVPAREAAASQANTFPSGLPDASEAFPDLQAIAAELATADSTLATPILEVQAEPAPAAEPKRSFSPWADMASHSDTTVPPLPSGPPAVNPPMALPHVPVAPLPATTAPPAGQAATVVVPVPAARPSAPALVFSSPAASAPAKPSMPALTGSMASLVSTATAAMAAPASPRAPADSPFSMLVASAAPAPIAAAPTPLPPALATSAAPPATAPRSYSRQILPVRLRPDEAHRKVKDRLYSLQMVELILHPVHLFDYECDVLQDGKLTFDTADGRIQVHGADKSTQDVDPDVANPEATGVLPPNHPHTVVERVLRIPEERALQLARAHVVKKHSRTVDMRVPDVNSSLYYTERRKVEPTEDQVRLNPLGIYFRPVWRLHGDNGFVDVDAMDGRELHVQLVGSRHGAIMLD